MKSFPNQPGPEPPPCKNFKICEVNAFYFYKKIHWKMILPSAKGVKWHTSKYDTIFELIPVSYQDVRGQKVTAIRIWNTFFCVHHHDSHASVNPAFVDELFFDFYFPVFFVFFSHIFKKRAVESWTRRRSFSFFAEALHETYRRKWKKYIPSRILNFQAKKKFFKTPIGTFSFEQVSSLWFFLNHSYVFFNRFRWSGRNYFTWLSGDSFLTLRNSHFDFKNVHGLCRSFGKELLAYIKFGRTVERFSYWTAESCFSNFLLKNGGNEVCESGSSLCLKNDDFAFFRVIFPAKRKKHAIFSKKNMKNAHFEEQIPTPLKSSISQLKRMFFETRLLFLIFIFQHQLLQVIIF